mgnify:CR=1 FL=1
MSRLLSKSQYTRGLQCVKSLFLYRHHRDLQDPITPAQQQIFDQGTEVGILARQLFPGGVLIEADHMHPEDALAATRAAIAGGAKVLYEAAAVHDGVLVRADIIVNEGGSWSLYEIKSTSEVKDVFLSDVAVQRYVLDGYGLRVGAAHLVHLNTAYVRHGALDLAALFAVVDVTMETRAALAAVPAFLSGMKAVADGQHAPDIKIGPHCLKPYECDFKAHCWADVPAYSVWNLANAKSDKKYQLWQDGVRNLVDIQEATTKLSGPQGVQVRVAKSGQPHIDRAAIAALLSELTFPRYFLDFETISSAIPPYDGLRPFQQLPFQASIHAQDAAYDPITHHEFLADGLADPRHELIEFLVKVIRSHGTVIAYNASFEGGCLKHLAEIATANNAARLISAEQRLWDLATPFRKAFYAHPGFKGSWSIKKTLPVCIPGMTYDGMPIADGVAAQVAYAQLMNGNPSEVDRAKIMAALKVYCRQDTLAMVRLLEHLEETVGIKVG